MATLKKLVNETTNIKNELVVCHNNLKNNLVEKGVECSDADKMSNLVSKVLEISKKISLGSNDVLISIEPDFSFSTKEYGSIFSYKVFFKGGCNVSYKMKSSSGTANPLRSYVSVYDKAGLLKFKSQEISVPTTSFVTHSVDLVDLVDTDSIEVVVYTTSNRGTVLGTSRNILITGNI